MSDLRCQVSEQGLGLVIKLEGRMTLAEMDEFEKQTDHITARKPTRLILDMADINIISSAGIGALLKLQRRANELKCDLRLAALQHGIEDLLRSARLDSIFTISPTISDAIN